MIMGPIIYLQAAVDTASQVVATAWPATVPPGSCSLPAARLLADSQLQLSKVELQLAVADASHAAADAAARRPRFPEVEGVSAAAVVAYVDEAHKLQKEVCFGCKFALAHDTLRAKPHHPKAMAPNNHDNIETNMYPARRFQSRNNNAALMSLKGHPAAGKIHSVMWLWSLVCLVPKFYLLLQSLCCIMLILHSCAVTCELNTWVTYNDVLTIYL